MTEGNASVALSAFMLAYCDGDAVAFSSLYSSVVPRIHRYLLKLCNGRRTMADDLLQTTFLKLHAARAAYIPETDPLPWIYAIAHRCYLDAQRRESVAKKHFMTLQWSVANQDVSDVGTVDLLASQEDESLHLDAHGKTLGAVLLDLPIATDAADLERSEP